MSLNEPRVPSCSETEAKQDEPCVRDADVVVKNSLHDHDREQFDPGSSDPQAPEAAVPGDSSSTSSTESDTEEFTGGGYTLLPQEPEEEKSSDWTTSDGANGEQQRPHSDIRTDASDATAGPVSKLEECEWRVIVSISQLTSSIY